MEQAKSKIPKVLRKFRGYLPEQLPLNANRMRAFTDEVLELWDIPDMIPYRQAVGTFVMHLGSEVNYKSKYFFAKMVRKAVSNHFAYEMLQELKEQDKLKVVPDEPA